MLSCSRQKKKVTTKGYFRGLDTHGRLSAFLYKGVTFIDFLFALPHTRFLLESSLIDKTLWRGSGVGVGAAKSFILE